MTPSAARPIALLALTVALILAPPPLPSRAAQAESVQRALARVVAEGDYQAQLADPDPQAPSSESGPGIPIVELLLRVLGVALLVAVVVGGLTLVLRTIARRPGLEPPPPPLAAPLSATSAPTVADLDARAHAGDLDAAIHDLLRRVLRWLVAREPALRPASLTSRELLAAAHLPAPAAAALAELVDAVERAVFAGRPAAAADWQRCRAAYARLEAAIGAAP